MLEVVTHIIGSCCQIYLLFVQKLATQLELINLNSTRRLVMDGSMHWTEPALGVLILLPCAALRFGLKAHLFIYHRKCAVTAWSMTCLVFVMGMQTAASRCKRNLLISMISFRR